jgi:hypothetical protein
MRAPNVAAEQEIAQLFSGPGVLPDRVMVLGERIVK